MSPSATTAAPIRIHPERIDTVLDALTEMGASDIKLVSQAPPIIFHQGSWQVQRQYEPLDGSGVETIHARICTDLRHKHIPPDGPWDCDYRTRTEHNNFRVNGGREQGRPFLILRPLPRVIPDFSGLQVLDDVLGGPPDKTSHLTQAFERALAAKRGLILVTGPTGSGKSTTLASFVNFINHTRAANIITIEDPIEYIFTPKLSHVLQREVGSDTSSFSHALRAALRQKPDVILVGEMRDKETIDAAFRAAATGHLVMSTLHNNEAAQTIERIINEFEPRDHNRVRHNLAETLIAVFSQQLLPTIEGGRQVIHEAMILTPNIRAALKPGEGKEGGSYLQSVRDQLYGENPYGSRAFDDELLRAAKAGLISEEVALEYATNPEGLSSRL